MQTLHKGKFICIDWQKENERIIVSWNDNTIAMTSEDYKSEMLTYVEYVDTYQPSTLIVNNQNFNFTIVPDLQQWTAENVYAKVAQSSMQAYAVLLGEDFIAKLAMEQVVEEDPFKIPYLLTDSLAKAEAWLAEQVPVV